MLLVPTRVHTYTYTRTHTRTRTHTHTHYPLGRFASQQQKALVQLSQEECVQAWHGSHRCTNRGRYPNHRLLWWPPHGPPNRPPTTTHNSPHKPCALTPPMHVLTHCVHHTRIAAQKDGTPEKPAGLSIRAPSTPSHPPAPPNLDDIRVATPMGSDIPAPPSAPYPFVWRCSPSNTQII